MELTSLRVWHDLWMPIYVHFLGKLMILAFLLVWHDWHVISLLSSSKHGTYECLGYDYYHSFPQYLVSIVSWHLATISVFWHLLAQVWICLFSNFSAFSSFCVWISLWPTGCMHPFSVQLSHQENLSCLSFQKLFFLNFLYEKSWMLVHVLTIH